MQGQGQPNRVGEVLGHFRLMKPLGKGGYDEVYLAENIHLGTQVAIKVLRARLVKDYEDLEQLRAEASVMMSLDHPHIVRVIDFGIDMSKRGPDVSTPYIVMEYAQGGDLQKRLKSDQPYLLEETLRIFAQLCSAVQHAHDRREVIGSFQAHFRGKG